MLKTTKDELGLLSEKDRLDFVKRGIRSGICGVTWMILLDAQNLYGRVMRKSLLIGNFSKTTDSVVTVLATADDAEFGFFVVDDLEHPTGLHDQHDDYRSGTEQLKLTRKCSDFYERGTSVNQGKQSSFCKILT